MPKNPGTMRFSGVFLFVSDCRHLTFLKRFYRGQLGDNFVFGALRGQFRGQFQGQYFSWFRLLPSQKTPLKSPTSFFCTSLSQ
jgi:hypothetical protein